MGRRTWFVLMMAFVALIGISACGGGGGSSGGNGGSATALTVADKVSVVDPNLSGSVAGVSPLRIGLSKVTAASLGSSAYNADKTSVYVNERSVESLNNVNNILCMVGQTGYDAMLNQPTYIALVDMNLCDSNKSDASNAGQSSQNQSSSASMPNYMKFVVNSTRADNNSPEIIKAWVHQDASSSDKPAIIYAHITVDEGKSDTNPYGIFTLNFAGFALDSNGAMIGFPNAPSFKGTLRAVRSNPSDPASKVVLQFVQAEQHDEGMCSLITSTQQVTLDRLPDGSAGAGVVKQVYSSATCSGATKFNIAYNTTNFFRRDLFSMGTPSFCMSRGTFDESAWSYGLYDSSGTRVNRNSGFPIMYNGNQGWVGYWGLGMNNGVTIPDGATVNKVDYNNGASTSTPYTASVRGGKLKKHTKRTFTLGEINGIPLNYWEQPATGGTGTNYEVEWDATNLVFKKIAEMPQNCSNNCFWSNIATVPTPTVDISRLQWSQLNFGFQTGGGQLMVTLGSPTTPCSFVTGSAGGPSYTDCSAQPPINSTPVIAYMEDVIYPDDNSVPGSFACFDNCPQATAAGIDPNNPYVSNMMSGPSQTATVYSFTNGMLTDMTGTQEVWSSGTSSMNQWGVMSGALFDAVYTTPSPTNPLNCDWLNGTGGHDICGWKAWGTLPVFYTWETGPNTWNQFIALKNGSTYLKFDPPLQVTYIDGGGTTFMMEYDGFGQLNGIPGKCVDMDTGADADCAQSQNSQSIRWVPQFVIPPLTGTDLTTVSVTDPIDSSTSTCYVKPLQVEQRMKEDLTGGACSFANAVDFSSYTLPTMSLWADPTTANGAEPNVTSAPAVIGGVVQ